MAYSAIFFKPDMIFTVRYKRVPPLIKFAGDVGVYYRGYKVGKATCRKLSADQRHILFCLRITYKGLKLPQNTEIILKTQDVFGDRYFDLVYPKKPFKKLISNGDVIDGTAVDERVDKYLVEQMERGELGQLISNLNWLTGSARMLLGGGNADMEELSEDTKKSIEDMSGVAGELKGFLGNPETKKSLKTTIIAAPGILKSISELLAGEDLQQLLKTAPELLDKTVTSLETVSTELPEVSNGIEQVNDNLGLVNVSLPAVNSELCGTNSLLTGTNGLLGNTNCLLTDVDGKIPVIPPMPQDLFIQVNRTLKRVDCLGYALGDTASKRALFFRFLFGKPGKAFENCAYPPCPPCSIHTTCPDYYYYCPSEIKPD